ncbi:MAG: hypothetical protein WC869_00940 [Phycisphaerae bacterium]|jgi:hypothetical protein
MAIKQLFGDRDHNAGVVKNYKFTVFANLAAANLVVGSVFGFAYMSDVGALYYNQTGLSWQPVGAKGSKGDTGAAGNTILSGAGAPGSGLGVDGNFYIDVSAVAIYGPKTAGVWGSPTSLIGTPGAPGGPGPPGADGNTVLSGVGVPSSGLGVNGNFYIDTAAVAIYGPKTGGVWGSATSLVGTPGAPGGPGPTGPPGPSGPPAAWDIAVGDVSTRTTVAAGPPSLAPVGDDPRYYFDSTATVMYKWNTTAWGLLTSFPFYYMDQLTGIISQQINTVVGGWRPVYNFGHAGLLTPIQIAAGTLTATSYAFVPLDSTAGAFSLALPAAASDDVVLELKDVSGKCDQFPITLTDVDGFDTGTSFVIDRAYMGIVLVRKTIGGLSRWRILSQYRKTPDAPGVAVTSAAALNPARCQTIDLDSTAGTFAVTLPASPREEDIVHLKDVSGTAELNVITLIAAAGFEGTTPVLDAVFMELTLVFRGGIWRVLSQYRNAVTPAVTINSAGTFAVKRDQTILYDVSGGSFAYALPGSPREGDKIRLKEKTGSVNTLTVTGTVDGTTNPVYNTPRQYTVLEYVDGLWHKMS